MFFNEKDDINRRNYVNKKNYANRKNDANEEATSNPTTRVPVCLCLDTSGSMGGEPIKELNRGEELFFEGLKQDEVASYSAEVCIVTFGDKGARCIRKFDNINVRPEIPVLEASGMTPMGEAVNIGLDKLEHKKKYYKARGIDYYQPWLVLMTDGYPNGSTRELETAIERTNDLAEREKLTIFPIGIGNEADMYTLARFSPLRSPLKLRGLRFREFFEWLSESVEEVSRSVPGSKVPVDTEKIFGMTGWGTLDS